MADSSAIGCNFLLCGGDEVQDYELAKLMQIKNIILLICATVLTIGLSKMSGSWHSLWAPGMLIFYSAVKVDST